jgi:hypothetical protein
MLRKGFSAPGAFSIGPPCLQRLALCAPSMGSRSQLKVRRDAHPPSVLGARRLRAGGPSQNRSLSLAQGGVGETASWQSGGNATGNRYRTRRHGPTAPDH